MNKPTPSSAEVKINWQEIDSVLLDMDGTLLDKYFDDYFWEKYVPLIYAQHHDLSARDAEEQLLKKYKSVESTLEWTDLNYWTRRLGLDIAQLKRDINHMIQVHNGAIPFLQYVRKIGKKLHLVTNAHSKTLEIKLEKAKIADYFHSIICSEDVGEAKEQVDFWYKLENHLHFAKERTLFADDTTKVLRAAQEYGIAHLLHIAKPSTQLQVRYSTEYLSIADFSEITPVVQ